MDAGSAVDMLGSPDSAERALTSLRPRVREWFQTAIGTPTMVQRLAWPAIESGRNLLLSGPTGSGKTLAAFMPILDRMLSAEAPGTRCVYVAPLKALINDVRKTARRCARALGARADGTHITISARTEGHVRATAPAV
jgi:ATP-dependent Lhr-like helicase